MAGKRITRKEVAALAGVSESVVSYVVNNYSYVSADKRARVEAAIQQLHYRPSAIGRALGRGITSHILFVVDHVLNENFSHMAEVMEQRAYQAGYILSLCNARNDDDFVGMVNSRRFDGLIISSSLLSEERIRSLAQYGTPIILLCARPYQMDLPNVLCVDTGIYTGTRQAIHYLVEQGRRNILYLDRTVAEGDEPGDDMKLRAYYDQLAADGLPVLPSHVISGAANEQEQLQMLEDCLRGGLPVDAVFGRNDRFAVPAMHLLQAMGYRVPEDISVIGFDDLILSRYTAPPLTTLVVQREAIARYAIGSLLEMLSNDGVKPAGSPPPVFSARFIKRGSA